MSKLSSRLYSSQHRSTNVVRLRATNYDRVRFALTTIVPWKARTILVERCNHLLVSHDVDTVIKGLQLEASSWYVSGIVTTTTGYDLSCLLLYYESFVRSSQKRPIPLWWTTWKAWSRRNLEASRYEYRTIEKDHERVRLTVQTITMSSCTSRKILAKIIVMICVWRTASNYTIPRRNLAESWHGRCTTTNHYEKVRLAAS